MKRVFVSYSRRNKTFAERLARDLSDAGLDVWIDFRQIHGGEDWRKEIYRGLERSEMMVVCLSPDSVNSQWVQREVLTARELGKTIIPVNVMDAFASLKDHESLAWLLDVQIIDFHEKYDTAFPELLNALPGTRRIGVFDDVDPADVPNPFKGLEAFQQTDAAFFFGREELVEKSLRRLRKDDATRFLAIVGASGSGKSSVMRAGVIPAIRRGAIPGSAVWPVMLFTPGANPMNALVTRMLPLFGDDTSHTVDSLMQRLADPAYWNGLVDTLLAGKPDNSRLLVIVDQFEEAFTLAAEGEQQAFIDLLHHAITDPNGRAFIAITMRADFFGSLSQHPALAELFERENMVIATEMTAANLLRVIEGPAQAVGVTYDPGLPDRILEEVRQQPGSLPLLQYALKILFERRDGRRMTTEAYEAIGGVRQALASHAEAIYGTLNISQQDIMRRILLKLVEVNENGEITRRRVARDELNFRDVDDAAIQDILDRLTAAESRLLTANREIRTSADNQTRPVVWYEVSHEALIREWERFKTWVSADAESLRYNSELLKAARDWNTGSRDTAYLLVGKRLTRAEGWLETADPTPLQQAYIEASIAERDQREAQREAQQARELDLQRRSTNRARLAVGILLISLVIAAGLIVVVLQSLSATQEAQELANVNFQEGRSLALSSSASLLENDDETDSSVALAVEANIMQSPPPQSQRTLADVAYSPGTRFLLRGHQFSVNTTAFSSDGRWFVTGGEAPRGIIMRMGQIIRPNDANRLAALNRRGCAFYDSDDTSATIDITGYNLGDAVPFNLQVECPMELIVWDSSTGQPTTRIGQDGEGHSAGIAYLAFSPNGRYLLSVDVNGEIIVWDWQERGLVYRYRPPQEQLYAVGFGLDGEAILTVTESNQITHWALDGTRLGVVDLSTGDEGDFFNAREVPTAAFSADGQYFAAGTINRAIVVWDTQTGYLVHVLPQQTGIITGLSFSPDNHFLLSGTDKGEIVVWDLRSGMALFTLLEIDEAVSAVAFGPRDERVAVALASGELLVWDIDTASPSPLPPSTFISLHEHTARINSVAFNPSGELVITGSDDTTARVWTLRNNEEIARFRSHSRDVNAVAISADGRYALSGASDNTMRLWDLQYGDTIRLFTGHTDRVNAVALSADGTQALSGSRDNTMRLWDTATGATVMIFDGHEDEITAVRFLPDGETALSASRDGTIQRWNLTTGEVVGSMATGAGYALAIDINPDGTLLVAGGSDNVVRLFDIATGEQTRTFEGHTSAVRAVAFDIDGLRIASGSTDTTLIVWDVETGEQRQILLGHDEAVSAVRFSQDNLSVLSGSFDGTLRLWDISSGFEIRRYTIRDATDVRILTLELSPDGRTVLTGQTDDTLRIWRLLPSVNELLGWTFVNRYVRPLTCAEGRLFRLDTTCGENGFLSTDNRPDLSFQPGDAAPQLTIGGQATINAPAPGVDDGATVSLLDTVPSDTTSGNVVQELQHGTQITIIQEPRTTTGGQTWWYVQLEDGTEGWVTETNEDDVRTLLPQ